MADIEHGRPKIEPVWKTKHTVKQGQSGSDVEDAAVLRCEVESLRSQLRGGVEALRDLVDEAAKAVCEPARFDQHDLGLAVARARRHVNGGQS